MDRVLKEIFNAKRKDLKGIWRKLHSEKIHDCMSHRTVRLTKLYVSLYIIKGPSFKKS